MTATLQELRPVHGKGIKRNPWPGIIGSVGILVVVMWAIYSGLAAATVQLIKANIKADVVKQEVKNDLPPPPPPPDFKPPSVVAVQQEVTIDLAAAPPAAPAVVAPPPPPAPPKAVVAAPPPAPPTPATPTTSHAVTADDYPALSIRLMEEGTVSIKYTIGADGTVSACDVVMTSGKPRLDDAACTMVKKRWKFKPATQGGKPVPVTNLAEVKFQLK